MVEYGKLILVRKVLKVFGKPGKGAVGLNRGCEGNRGMDIERSFSDSGDIGLKSGMAWRALPAPLIHTVLMASLRMWTQCSPSCS
ncbi:hypothetical protein H8959_002876 [Pygathrix nigripes]